MQNQTPPIAAAYTGLAIADRSHWGKIVVAGDDRLRFLHNQSTADFLALKPGMSCDTVFVTATARTIDLATAWIDRDEVFLLFSPERRQFLFDWLDRYIFVADKVTLTDVSDRIGCLTIIGPESDRAIAALGWGEPIDRAEGDVWLCSMDDFTVRVAVGSGLGLPGYTLTCEMARIETLMAKITALGAMPLSDEDWERLRIQQGRPAPERELTDEYNPLEVGLWQTISFSKGCYIGQETIARLNTYRGVKQYLWGVKFTTAVAADTHLTIDGEKVGRLTSSIVTEDGTRGLAYIKSKAGGVGTQVMAETAIGEIVALPFVSHEYPAV
jgi:tRNA-modifying protein YgfZ